MNRAQAASARAAVPFGLAGLGALLLWLLLGDLGVSMRERAALPSALELLRRHAASDTTISLLLSTVPALLSMLLVPLAGYHSDRSRSRLGRRTPFLLVAAPVGGLALLGLSASPTLAVALDAALGGWSPGLPRCRLALFCLFWAAFDCAAISAFSLFTGLVNDLVPAGLLGRFFAVFRIAGLGIGITYHRWIFALTDQHLREVLVGVALFFCLPILAMALLVKERPLPPDAAPPGPPLRRLRFPFEHVLACFRYRPYGWAVAAFVLSGVTFSPFNTFYLHYAHAAGVPKSTLGTLTAVGYAVSIASAFAIGSLADRFGAVRVSTLLMAAYCAVSAAGFAGVSDAASYRAFYLAHVVISGAWFTAAASMPMALFPRASFVQFNSTKDLMAILGTIVVSSIQGPMLDLSGHDYRFTLLAGAIFSLLCVACLSRLQSGSLAAQVAARQAAPPPHP
ncbi:MFS transporter [Roseateles sp. BYS78W]|uniref:MFS transporter n=1 Tax=Pelomonas candidula TaxID=3299025 RepID=A0ABW7HGV5_9BURK